MHTNFFVHGHACASAKATYMRSPVFWHAMLITSLFAVYYSKMEFTYCLRFRGLEVLMHFSYSIYTVWFLNFPSLYTGRLDQVHAVYLLVGAF